MLTEDRTDQRFMKLAATRMPHIGGTYSGFCRLRKGLAAHQIVLRWLGVGPAAAAIMRENAWAHERSNGEVVAPDVEDDGTAARLLLEHLEQERYDGVLVSVACGRLLTNLTRYLPSKFSRVMVVHTTSLASYKAARAVRDYAPATICVSPRIRNDLVAGYGFDEKRTFVISNAVDVKQYQHVTPSRGRGRTLKVISLGRLEDESKGILWLPEIFAKLNGLDVSFTIAGDGPDRARLQDACAEVSNRVTFLGQVSPDDVPWVFARHDVFLMPSRYEGFGHALIEAMAAGCVPVASRISGVTDTIVRPDEDGFLFPIGDTRAAADIIRSLARDRTTLERRSDAVRRNVRDRFSIERMASQYAHVLRQARDAPARTVAPLPLASWSYPLSLRPGLRTYLPTPVKKSLRLWRERLAACGNG